MSPAIRELISVLREARESLARPGNEFVWSPWEDADEAVTEITRHIATLEGGNLPRRLDLEVLFAPTGPIQEVSVSSGWGQDFLDLAARFDTAARRAYRWSLVHAVRRWLTGRKCSRPAAAREEDCPP